MNWKLIELPVLRRAARQIREQGGDVRAGLRVQFWYVYSGVKVRDVDSREIDVGRYRRLIDLAVEEVLESWQLGREQFEQYELPAFLLPKIHPEKAY
ncbi:MAG: hypothetical protein PVJ21_22220 [Anaerolineales bacterium]